jgi:hypothetical protein
MEADSRAPRCKRVEKRKCLCCKGYFKPDRRNRRHQKYCTKPLCRKASKKAAQQRWLSSEKGVDYFCGPYHVGRVQRWRKNHPGYWKNTACNRDEPLQDLLDSQGNENKGVTNIRDDVPQSALQDVLSMQPALFVGLIASLTGSTLQDDIARATRRFIDSGRDILCNAPQPLSP